MQLKALFSILKKKKVGNKMRIRSLGDCFSTWHPSPLQTKFIVGQRRTININLLS